ncbi:hypothetical protein F511_03748 [Dorcoceras hygrometricum]|uniref:NB-ARC domain-containing protein n=1 Tax=Dorcoceras hygrometricum TaxID=472368 RepID=A0A2Z7B6H9_9LAMI|nr:hypothetical protein F511_03748 [Dorcoceras hygrometricum]
MEDIQNHLLEQLENAINDVTKEPFGSSSIFVECRRLKDLIKNGKPKPREAVDDDAIRRENLYYLNNIVAEWRVVLEKHSQYSPAAQIALNGQLTDRLKKIRKNLESHYPVTAQKDGSSTHAKVEVDEGPDKEKSDEKYSRGLLNPYDVDRSKIWGIDDKSKAMERLLVRKETRNKEFQAIGIVGMTGVGKTTLCQVAFNNEQVKKHFAPRLWVEMSEQPVEDEDYNKEVVKKRLNPESYLLCLFHHLRNYESRLRPLHVYERDLDRPDSYHYINMHPCYAPSSCTVNRILSRYI